jgi:hypothetical protein
MIKRRTNEPLDLFGFLDVAPKPTFLTPVFTDDRNLFLQDAETDDLVSGFSALPSGAHRRTTPLDDLGVGIETDGDSSCAVGKPALHAFCRREGSAWVMRRPALIDHLLTYLHTKSLDPFLRLELLEFVEAPVADLARAIRHCKIRLARQGVSQAEGWAADQYRRLGLEDAAVAVPAGRLVQELVPLPQPRDLCLAHVTNMNSLRDMLRTGSISPKHDKLFGEDLVYFFYGRPTYKGAWRAGKRAADILERAPVCIVLRTDGLEKPHRVFPFDTSVLSSLISRQKHADWPKLQDYECAVDDWAPRSLVANLWGDNDAYMRGNIDLDIHDRDSALVRFVNRQFKRNPHVASQATAIEVQYDREVPLRNQLAAIIVPDQLARESALQDFARRNRFPIHTYLWQPGVDVPAYEEVFIELLLEIYEAEGAIGHDTEGEGGEDELASPEADIGSAD